MKFPFWSFPRAQLGNESVIRKKTFSSLLFSRCFVECLTSLVARLFSHAKSTEKEEKNSLLLDKWKKRKSDHWSTWEEFLCCSLILNVCFHTSCTCSSTGIVTVVIFSSTKGQFLLTTANVVRSERCWTEETKTNKQKKKEKREREKTNWFSLFFFVIALAHREETNLIREIFFEIAKEKE